ncbi:TnsD family Tn7-like transposition protein [Hylemonella sp. W303a]|uniref:TnsD family Tn7-like transposition protein n=1 Tax=Hylemonella sp. W303a TaxID=3389873 RepID=UPI00396B1181
MDDLFPRPPLLPWLPGETLFSLVSRHDYFRGNPAPKFTSEQFFGHPLGGAQHDFPTYLGEFASRTDGLYGDAQQIALEHTLMAFYGAFISNTEARRLAHQMSGRSVALLKSGLGLQQNGFRAHHPLKACRLCMEEDREAFGWSYWHLEHQYPGACVCLKHAQLLQAADMKVNGVHPYLWCLPSEMNWDEMSPQTSHSQEVFDAARSLTQTARDLHAQCSAHKDLVSRLHEHYMVEVVQRDWVTATGNLRMPKLAASFLEHIRPLRAIPGLQALPKDWQEAESQLSNVLRPRLNRMHPLRHIVVCDWLYGSATPLAQRLVMNQSGLG